jgi:NADH-quinone oxidoreductase subunit E
MSVRRLAADQPEGFAFTPENLEWAKAQIKKYPEGRQASAVLALLWRAQEQMGGWLPEPALRYVGDMLGLAPIRVYEIATFYTMFNLAPVGRYYVQVCGTTPCWLRGADAIKNTCRKLIGEPNHVTRDGMFSWTEVECLGACVNAPMVQINKDYYEDLTPESFERILANLKDGRPVTPGPQNGRAASAPLGGPMTLLDAALYANEEPEEELVGAHAALTDAEAKRPGKAANVRDAGVPKPPLGKGRKKRSP